MDVSLKLSTFEKLIKKYTLCAQCDGKISKNPFYVCGCGNIFCSLCHEKHICGSHRHAVKYDCTKNCKSIDFINDLAKLAFESQEGKDSEKLIKEKIENSCSIASPLPDLDNLAVCRTPEVSFSQLFDEVKGLRNEKPIAIYSGSKRESISPRISYTLKRNHQYLSDTDDDDVFEKNEQNFQKKLSSVKLSDKKRETKKRRLSIKKIKPSVDAEHNVSNNQQDGGKRSCYPFRASESVLTPIPSIEEDIKSILSYNPSSSNDLIMFSVDEGNKSTEDLNHFDYTDDFLYSDKQFENVESPMENKSNQQTENVDGPMENKTENAKGELKSDATLLSFETFENNIELDQLNEYNDIYKNSTPRMYKPKFYYHKIKQRDTKSFNRNRESLRSAKKVKTVDNNTKNCNNIVVNNKRKDFDGFNQSEINASTLNLMLFKLTTNEVDNDEMKFPMHYRGKTIFFHIGKPVIGDDYDIEHDFFIKRVVNVKSDFTQTGDDPSIAEAHKRDDAHPSKICQSEKCEIKDACIGPDSSKHQKVQTDPIFVKNKSVGHEAAVSEILQTESYETVDVCVGREAAVSEILQTESYETVDACVGREAAVSEILQTESYETVDACVGHEAAVSGILQTESYETADACVGPIATVSKSVETDLYQTSDAGAGPREAIPKIVQTDSYQVVETCSGPDGEISEGIQTDSYQVQDFSTSYISPDFDYFLGTSNYVSSGVQTESVNITPPANTCTTMPRMITDGNFHSSSMNLTEQNLIENSELTNSGYATESHKNVRESPDSEDDDIIEGTPVKSINHSFSGRDALAMKEQLLHFDLLNGSRITRSEVVSCTDLTNEEKELVKKFTKSYGMEYSELFNHKTTHIMISSRLFNGSHKTYKYMMAIASKTYVVSMLWIEESLQAECVLPVERYIPTSYLGPSRCRMNIQPPFSGLTICSTLLTTYPGVKAMEALCKLCGAYIMEDLEKCSLSQNWPFPRFCLFENESDLTSQVLNICSRNLIVAINFTWVFDSVVAYKRVSILKHLSPTFMLTDAMCDAYRIPHDLIVDVE